MTTPPGSVATRPAAVSTAVKLMYVIAGLGLLGLLLTALDTDAVREQVRASPSASSLSPSDFDTAVTVAIAFALVVGLISAGLWVLFAIFTGRGRNWARIVSTVLAALSVIAGFSALRGGISLLEVPSLLAALAAIGVIALLYRPESSRFFASGGLRRGRDDDPGEPGYPSYPPVQQP